jgi:signal transduction histidine kinase/integral membrane sensor domain MASE1
MGRQRMPTYPLLGAVALLYFLAGRFGLSLALIHKSVSGIWPASGIALAICLLAGNRVWPGIYIGSFLVNITTSHALGASLLIAGGNTLECLLGAWLVRRFAGGLAAFDTAPAILFFAESVVAAALVAATIGLFALSASGLVTPDTAPSVWLTWWLGDASGALVITPLIIFWKRESIQDWTWQKALEALLLFIVVGTTGYAMFAGLAAERRYPLTYLPFPVLLWAALRFGPRETMTVIVFLAALAVEATLRGVGPFGRPSAVEEMVLMHSFLAICTVASLALASESARRRATEEQVRQLNVDLAARVEARTDELRRSHGRLAEAQHVAHLGSWEWDIDADTIWWSDELYRIYDVPHGTPIKYGMFLQVVHPDDRAALDATVRRAIETKEPFSFEHRVIRSNGKIRVLSANGRVTTDESGRATRMIGIGHDITDRKQAEEERLQLLREQEARKEAEESNRSKDHFLATLSHELRTPLNAVLGWAEILRNPRADEELRTRAIDAINRNVAIQAQLVSDILDVARIRRGTLQLTQGPLVLTDVINSALESVLPMIASKNIDVRVSVAPGAEKLVGDGHRLQQVFWNLLSNAAKFTPANGRVAVKATTTDHGIAIAVEDNGPGIDPTFLPHVFEQFSQADRSVTRQHGGLGLGLAITHHLIRLHDGEIAAANRPEGGAVFTIRLPVHATTTRSGAA